MPSRPLSAEERALWERVIASVTPLEGRAVESSRIPAKAGVQPSTSGSGPRPSPGHSSTSPTHAKPSNTLDGSWDRRLSRGTVAPDLAVDLHGYSLEAAYRVLDQGLEHAIRSEARVLLLITGKPRAAGSGRGTIRAAVGDWLGASRHAEHIAAVRNAHPRHGGSGALYIVLRRPKSPRQTRQS